MSPVMDYIPESLRHKIREAARHRCGYCLTAQEISGAQMHIEHILPRSRGGTSEYIVPARRHWVSAGWHPPKD